MTLENIFTLWTCLFVVSDKKQFTTVLQSGQPKLFDFLWEVIKQLICNRWKQVKMLVLALSSSPCIALHKLLLAPTRPRYTSSSWDRLRSWQVKQTSSWDERFPSIDFDFDWMDYRITFRLAWYFYWIFFLFSSNFSVSILTSPTSPYLLGCPPSIHFDCWDL